MEMTEQNNDRAMIYDYRTGEEIRQATAEEEQRYINELLGMMPAWRTAGFVSGEPYGYDGSVYMSGGRVELINQLPNVDMERASQLWDRYVGQNSAEEFMTLGGIEDIEESVEDYMDDLDGIFGAGTLAEAPEDIEEMLAAYIRHERIMTQLEGSR